ncbi:MAG: OFA family MFS transporter [Firmicutes bacterium]|nr:OFA family MFS transporter [Bacillota bacterium]
MKNKNKGLQVVLAGTGINLAFGVLYAWSIFGGALSEEFGWSKAEASLPYTVAIIAFAFIMVPAGRLQDKIGPKWVATLGGLLIGAGCILASFLPSVPGLVFAFGILAGSGIGLGYASTTPAAVKWFAPEKKGLITGVVVGGFGLASIYIAPLTKYLLHEYGVFTSFRILGFLFLAITLPLSQLIVNPEKPVVSTNVKKKVVPDLTWQQMLKTKEFYQLWFMFFAGATGGLMIIGHLKTIAKLQLGTDAGFMLVALAAIANAIGRPAAGVISDKFGRGKTMMFLYILQAVVLFIFSSFSSFTTVLLGAMVMYFSYGSMLSVYPSACGDNYGTKNLGMNYGILFSAWGAGGTVGPMIGGFIADSTGSYSLAFTIAAGMVLLAAAMGYFYKPYHHQS